MWASFRVRRCDSEDPDNAQADHAVLADLRAASGPAAWVAPGRITRERTCRWQRLLVGRRAHLMELGRMMTNASAMLAADVAAIGRREAT